MAKQQQNKKNPAQHAKKAKVFIPTEKIILFCTVIFALCAILLAVPSFIDSSVPKTPQNSQKSVTKQRSSSAPHTEQRETEAKQYVTQVKNEQSAPQTKQNDGKRQVLEAETAAETQNAATKVPQEKAKTKKSAPAHEKKESLPETSAAASYTAAGNTQEQTAFVSTAEKSSLSYEPAPSAPLSPALIQAAPNSAGSSSAMTQKTAGEHGMLAEKKTEIASIKTAVPRPEVQPVPIFDIPPAVKGAVLVFVFDDAGLNPANVKRYTALPFPVTIAVLPKLSHSRECADITRTSGNEVILHQPMQAVNIKVNPGPGAILPEMSTFEIASVLKENLSEIGPVKGLNNHEGSLITQDVIKIGTVLDVADEVGIFFLDSRTTAETKAPQAALERGMQIYERDVFIDDVITRRVMLSEICRGINIANKKGAAIMIGHVDKSVGILPALLADLYPHLVKNGYRFSTVSNSPVKTQ